MVLPVHVFQWYIFIAAECPYLVTSRANKTWNRLAKSFQNDTLFPKLVILSRFLFLSSVALQVTGGIYTGQYHDPKSVSLGIKLVRAGYAVAVVLLVYLSALQSLLWSRKRFLDRCSQMMRTEKPYPGKISRID